MKMHQGSSQAFVVKCKAYTAVLAAAMEDPVFAEYMVRRLFSGSLEPNLHLLSVSSIVTFLT